MKKNVEFTEVVVHYNRIKILKYPRISGKEGQ